MARVWVEANGERQGLGFLDFIPPPLADTSTGSFTPVGRE